VTVGEPFDRRALRAGELRSAAGSVASLLSFAAGLFSAQGRLATALASLHALQPLTGSLPDDVDRLLPLLSPFLSFAGKDAPEELAAEASRRSAEPAEAGRARLVTWWESGGAATEDYLSRAFLRPYLEFLASERVAVTRPRLPGHCPVCGGPPVLSVRRADPESEAGRRFLVCAHCGGEWPFGRIRCPSCFEESPDRLPTFQAEKYSGVRIEACETCHRYLKSLDLTLDARPIPEVDDLATAVLDLWAQEEGFTRIEPGAGGL
jgi:formate dehydrogenase maturation protein FdhE